MVSLRQLVQGIAGLALLEPCLAVSLQAALGGGLKAGVFTEDNDNPACKDTFYATMYVPQNATSGPSALPVVHRNGYLFAMKDKDPTQWAIQRSQNGKHFVSAAHPGGTRHYWYSNAYDHTIGVTQNNYQAKEVSFYQSVQSDTPFSSVTVAFDDQCLVVPSDESQALQMFPQSACDTIILQIVEPLKWETPNDSCNGQKSGAAAGSDVHTAAECKTYEDCPSEFPGWRCCTKDMFQHCGIANPFRGTDDWKSICT